MELALLSLSSNEDMEFRTNILLIPARIYQYALTLLILLQEAQLNHTTGLA